jgi:hypothetical protein
MKANRLGILLLCATVLQAVTIGAQPVTKISAGATHSLFLKSDGSVWFTDGATNGPLGDGTLVSTNRFEALAISNVTAIAAGGMHNLFVKSDGSLWTMGNNYYGQLGDGTFGAVPPFGTNQPEQIVSSNVTAISGGGFSSLFLKNNGSLWAMGWNQHGQLGDGTTDNGTYKTNQPEQIVGSNVTAVAAGAYHSLFLKHDGSLWGMGRNFYGELGDGSISLGTRSPEQIVASNVTAIAVGIEYSLFLKSDGSLWGMGDNTFGQLGIGPTNNAIRPKQIVASNVTAIAAGAYYSLFLKSDGSLWGMGTNNFGQLGDGTFTSTNRPEQILAAYNQISIQLLSDGHVRLAFVGIAGANYALDRSFNLSSPNWVSQVTNPAGAVGTLVFTNTPYPTTNNFWRIRSVPKSEGEIGRAARRRSPSAGRQTGSDGVYAGGLNGRIKSQPGSS